VLDDRVGAIRERIAASPFRFALVAAPGGVVLGKLRSSALSTDPELLVEEVVEVDPSTVRPDAHAGEPASRLAERHLRFAIITTPEGRLLGSACREDLERT
jgi:hypothetical protein